MSDYSDYELEREANIARNRALLASLDITADLPPVKKQSQSPKTTAKPVQPAKKAKREKETPTPVRQSTRLRKTITDPNESPAKKRKREKEEEERRAKEEEERLEAEERARQAKKPRHNDLDLGDVTEDLGVEEATTLRTTFSTFVQTVHSRRVAAQDAFVFDDDAKESSEVKELRSRLGTMQVVARAKVTQDRVYSAAYHPEPSKDLVFFGDKHGQLGIWDARAPSEEAADDDGEISAPADGESGKYWRLQLHWPATSKSSISSVKFDPIDCHSVFTSSYDCTIRKLSFTSGISSEIFSIDETLISCIELPASGNEMWISDASGGLTHLDLREDKSKARRYQISEHKIGCVSANPAAPHYLVTASNSRAMRIWDARKLTNFEAATDSNGCLRAEWRHGKSVSSAYWDPRGRSIISTCYDDTLRLWELNGSVMKSSATFPSSRPFSQINHNCQTGKWLTVLKAQWSPNPDHYPHFTVGNMKHSLDIFSCKGELIARLADRQKISAVQAVTSSHPSVLERAASGNGSGRCVLWAPPDL